MGKSVVLKDLDNRIAGYVQVCETGILCRMQLDAPAQMTVLFADGLQKEYAVAGGNREQHFDEACRTMSGCYVFRADRLLLISDENMRAAFEKRLLCSAAAEKKEAASAQRQAGGQTQSRQEKENHLRADEREIPQRRWPPPVCWDGAQYRQGRWEEE